MTDDIIKNYKFGTMKYFLFSFFCLLGIFQVSAQKISINEVVASNAVYVDEDGDTPDWIELHNYGSQTTSLDGWSLSDDQDNLKKWSFPDITLPPNQYMLLWASSKNRTSQAIYKTLINQGDTFKYSTPTSEPSSNWKSLDFNDANWLEGPSGFGYADGDDATMLPNGTVSVYLRKKIIIQNTETISSLILDIDYDDAFVAYLNGFEIARANINGAPPLYNANAITFSEAQMYSGGTPKRFIISDFKSILREGENILTIQAHNSDVNSSDFTIIPFLSASFSAPTNHGVSPPEILNLKTTHLHTNFRISSTSETLFLTDKFGTIIDEITVEKLPPNTSTGISIKSGNIVFYEHTTPSYENSIHEYLGTINNEVVFSHQGGFVENPFSLVLSGSSSPAIIRYELGGKIPDESSPMYTNPIPINENLNVRAQIFLENYLPSKVFTKSYMLRANHVLDVVFLSTNPDNFFDETNGIYAFGPAGTYETTAPYFGANFWEDWEKPIHFSFFEQESRNVVDFDGGVKIFGGWSRGQNEQRSLALFARGRYGDSEFNHSYFKHLNYTEFQSLVLRNSGQDWLKSSMKDIMLTSLMRGSDLDFQEHHSVATYLNGAYWGMYHLREKINEHMLASKHNLNANDITLLTNNAEEIEGSNASYQEIMQYVSNTDLSTDSNFEYIEQQIDIKEYALYQATNIFMNNTDWPGNNVKFWKHPNGKWRWIMYDTDFSFGPFWNTRNYWEDTLSFALEANGPAWPNPSWSTLLFRKLITNIGFRNMFINLYADELNTRFLSSNINEHIDQIYKTIEPELQVHYSLWGANSSEANYYIDEMKIFAGNRSSFVKDHIKSKFNLPNYHAITIKNNELTQGFVNVNDHLQIQNSSWTGDYFETIPIKLTAIPKLGYEFSHWSGAISSSNNPLHLNVSKALEVIPNFKPSDAVETIVINEINYKSSDDFNANDWVELYNPNSYSLDVSNWSLKDDDDTHVFNFPAGTTMPPKGYLVLVRDPNDFTAVFPEITNYVGNLGFGLGTSDAVRLFNQNTILQDEVIYFSDAPWSSCANGTGNTLELMTPNSDNNLPENWKCLNPNGSPNAINSNTLSLNKENFNGIYVYPNPAKNILYVAGAPSNFEVEIYSPTGQKVFKSENTNRIPISQLSEGVYFIKIMQGQKSKSLKFIKQ
jgi:hypothetical protein